MFIAKTLNALDLAALAFNDPAFISNAEGSDLNLLCAIEGFVEMAAFKWQAHSGILPTARVQKEAMRLLTEMAGYALLQCSEEALAQYNTDIAADNLAMCEYAPERLGRCQVA